MNTQIDTKTDISRDRWTDEQKSTKLPNTEVKSKPAYHCLVTNCNCFDIKIQQ